MHIHNIIIYMKLHGVSQYSKLRSLLEPFRNQSRFEVSAFNRFAVFSLDFGF